MIDEESRFPAENYQYLTDAGLLALSAVAVEQRGLSARPYHRVLKAARTISDLAGEKDISPQHVAEAVQCRRLDGQIHV